MTNIYYVRHAQPNYENHNDQMRELTQKGCQDRKRVTEYLREKPIDLVVSSPYKRAVDTISEYAEEWGHSIRIIEDFRERRVDRCWIEDFEEFARAQWADFDYKRSDGETLRQVQQRNLAALADLLQEQEGKHIVIGGHGTALAVILDHYYGNFGYEGFRRMRAKMPWLVQFTFEKEQCIQIREIDLVD